MVTKLRSVKSKSASARLIGPNTKVKESQTHSIPRSDDIHLRLLATSDLHVNIMPFDYYSGTVVHRLGLARTASLIAIARAEAENCLLFDNGDFLQGSPLGDYIAQLRGLAGEQSHPMIAAMNHLAYDAGTLGNHEFNYGVDFLNKSIAKAQFPIVSANVYLDRGQIAGKTSDQTADQTFVAPYVILNRTMVDTAGHKIPIKIGVIGFTPPQIMLWDHQHLTGKLTTRDSVEIAIACIPQIKRQGADLIIALSHSGIGPAQITSGMENTSTALANIEGIDAVIAGHVHLVFPSSDFAHTPDVDPQQGTLCGKPAVMPGFFGSHLGVIDLFLSHKAGKFKVERHQSQARPIWHRGADGGETALTESDPSLVTIVSAAHLETLRWANRPIGHAALPLHSFFALLTEAPALQLVAAAQALHVGTTLASTPFAALPVLAAVAPYKAGGRGGPENYTDVPAGDVLLRNAADLYIYPNTSAAIRMTGTEIADWLEYAAGIFNQILPGSTDTPLINPDFPSFNFDMIFGLQFQIDLRKPPRFDLHGALINPTSRRILTLSCNGMPLDPLAVFAVATNSYRIGSHAGFLRPNDARVLFQSSENNLDVVLRYFSRAQNKVVDCTKNRKFLAMPGTTVTFDTSPKAIAHLTELAPMQIDPICLLPTGFMRFRLHL